MGIINVAIEYGEEFHSFRTMIPQAFEDSMDKVWRPLSQTVEGVAECL